MAGGEPESTGARELLKFTTRMLHYEHSFGNFLLAFVYLNRSQAENLKALARVGELTLLDEVPASA